MPYNNFFAWFHIFLSLLPFSAATVGLFIMANFKVEVSKFFLILIYVLFFTNIQRIDSKKNSKGISFYEIHPLSAKCTLTFLC